MLIQNDALAAPYLGFLNPFIAKYDSKSARQFLIDLAKKYPNNSFTADAVISNLAKKEAEFQKELAADSSTVISKRLKKLMDELSKKSVSNLDVSKEYPKGANLFRSICQTCHGADGNGINGLAPPLNKSDWVTGDQSRLVKVLLYGLAGPIKVGERLYKAPEISGEMPGIASNTSFSDEDIAQVANYIRNSWSNKADKVSSKSVTEIRAKYKSREKAFTEAELNQ
jgi:mono/diheme cytochrome c family protein